MQEKKPASVTFKRIDPEDDDWENKLENIMDRKIRSSMRERGLLDSADMVMKSPSTKEIMAYPNIDKLKPPPINPYDGTKDPMDYMQMF